MRKFFGTSAASREPIPEAKRAAGVEGGEEFFAEYFNQALYETQVDYIIGTTTQVTNGTANVKIGAGSVFQDALGATVVFAQGDRIAIAGHDALDADLVFTANDLVFMMNPGITIDQNSAYKTTISGLNCRGNLNFSNAFASSIIVSNSSSLLDIQTDLDGSVLAPGDVVINGKLYNDWNRDNILYGCYEVAQLGTSFLGAITGYHLDGFHDTIANIVDISQESSGAPIGSWHYAKFLYGSAASSANSAQLVNSFKVEKIKGTTITGSILVRGGGSFAADLTLRVQKNATADTMTGGAWSDIGSSTIANADIPTGTTSEDWALVYCIVSVLDDAAYNGIRLIIEPSTTGASGEFFCLAQPQLHVGARVNPYTFKREPLSSFRAYASGATALGGGSYNQIELSTEVFDILGDFASNSFVAKKSGRVFFSGSIECSTAPVNAWFGAALAVDGAVVAQTIYEVFAANKRNTATVSAILELSPGQTVDLRGYINSVGSFNTTSGIGTQLSGYQIGD